MQTDKNVKVKLQTWEMLMEVKLRNHERNLDNVIQKLLKRGGY